MAENIRGRSQAEIVRELLAKIEGKLSGDEVKFTLADYVRLVQLKQELDEEEPRDIRVTWVEGEREG